MSGNVKLGVSLYSLSGDYIKGRMTLEDCLKAVSEMGFRGVEIVAAQMVPEYPNPSDQWLYYFRELLDKYGLEPVCWSAYIDNGLRSDRDCTREEIVQFTYNDLLYAKKAGFPLVRTQQSISPAILESMVPACEQLNMRLAIEMHHPHHPAVPVWQEYIALMQRYDCLGVVPDFSIFQNRPHRLLVERLVRAGFRPEKLDAVLSMHAEGAPAEGLVELALSAEELAHAEALYEKFNPCALDALDTLIPISPYIHGKFYILDDAQIDPCIPYEQILPRIDALGYKGYIAAEYEGHHFDMSVDVRAQLARYASIFNRYLEAPRGNGR